MTLTNRISRLKWGAKQLEHENLSRNSKTESKKIKAKRRRRRKKKEDPRTLTTTKGAMYELSYQKKREMVRKQQKKYLKL